MALITSQMEMPTLDNTKMVSHTAKDNIPGKVAKFTLVLLRKE